MALFFKAALGGVAAVCITSILFVAIKAWKAYRLAAQHDALVGVVNLSAVLKSPLVTVALAIDFAIGVWITIVASR